MDPNQAETPKQSPNDEFLEGWDSIAMNCIQKGETCTVDNSSDKDDHTTQQLGRTESAMTCTCPTVGQSMAV